MKSVRCNRSGTAQSMAASKTLTDAGATTEHVAARIVDDALVETALRRGGVVPVPAGIGLKAASQPRR